VAAVRAAAGVDTAVAVADAVMSNAVRAPRAAAAPLRMR
jgi:hypothetical protein